MEKQSTFFQSILQAVEQMHNQINICFSCLQQNLLLKTSLNNQQDEVKTIFGKSYVELSKKIDDFMAKIKNWWLQLISKQDQNYQATASKISEKVKSNIQNFPTEINPCESLNTQNNSQECIHLSQKPEHSDSINYEKSISIVQQMYEQIRIFLEGKNQISLNKYNNFLQDLNDDLFNSTYCLFKKQQELFCKKLKQKSSLPAIVQIDSIQIQKIVEDQQLICENHKCMVYYICLNEGIKQNIYLCNQCILEVKTNDRHRQHEIICSKHKEVIGFKQQAIQNDQQIFLCKKCLLKAENVFPLFISTCHFEAITYLCTNGECIKDDDFKVCPACPFTHLGHKTVLFSQSQLINNYEIQEQNTNFIEDRIINVKESLKLNPIVKIIESYLKDSWHLIRIVESFAINNNMELQKWVEYVLKEAKKEDMFVLWSLSELKRKKISKQQKSDYLQSLYDFIQKNVEELLKQTFQAVKKFQKKIRIIEDLDNQTMKQNLSQKYSEILNIEGNDRTIILPYYLQDIKAEHYKLFQKICVNKQREEQSQQLLRKIWRERRRRFYIYQISKILQQSHISEQDKKNITCLFCKQQYKDGYNLKINLDELTNLSACKQQIMILKQQFQKIQKYFQGKIKECLPFCLIDRQQLTQLKVIDIRYEQYIKNYYKSFSDKFRYAISAFDLFKLIHRNKKLTKVSIQGAEISNLQYFMKQLYPETDDQSLLKENSWIKELEPSKSLKLSIDAEVIFKLYNYKNNARLNKDSFCKINQLRNLRGLFHSLSNITITIELGDLRQIEAKRSIVQKLFQCLKQFSILKLNICGKDETTQSIQILSSLIFRGLASFEEISQLSIRGVQFHVNVKERDFIAIQNVIQELFSNNQIIHLGLHYCKNCPFFPSINTLKSIDFRNIQFRKKCPFLSKMVNNNNSLRSIKCFCVKQQWSIKQSIFDQLQAISIDTYSGFSMSNISSPSLSKIRYFCIDNTYNLLNIDFGSLESIFPKLANLTYLEMNSVHFGSQIISLIPSPHLQQLILSNNKQFTNYCLSLVDSKWPYLTSLSLKYYHVMSYYGNDSQLTEDIFRLCKFRGIFHLNISPNKWSNRIKHQLKRRGIKAAWN